MSGAAHFTDTSTKRRFSLWKFALLALGLVALFLIFRHREIHVYDGFESCGVGHSWTQIRMVPGSFRVQSEVGQAGRGAGEITVHSGDRREQASDGGAATERDERMEAWWRFAHMHRTYRYSFSLYLPADFAIVPTRLVLAQWKQVCE